MKVRLFLGGILGLFCHLRALNYDLSAHDYLHPEWIAGGSWQPVSFHRHSPIGCSILSKQAPGQGTQINVRAANSGSNLYCLAFRINIGI